MSSTAITLVLAAGGILVPVLVAIVLYRLQRRTKRFGYFTLFDQAVFNESDVWNGTLELRFRGTPVQNVHLISLFFENNGHLPITPEDQREPIVVDFGSQARILSAEVSAQRPSDLNIQTSSEGAAVSIVPVLLNRWDTFTLKILVSEYKKAPLIRGRIVGVERIELLRLSRGWGVTTAAFFVGTIICVQMRDDLRYSFGGWRAAWTAGSLACLLLAILSLVGFIRSDLVQLEKWRSKSKGSPG